MCMRLIFLHIVLWMASASYGQDKSCAISGTVLDSLGQPVFGARVSFSDSLNQLHYTYSNVEGQFKLDSIQPGTINLFVDKLGFKQMVIEDITMKNGMIIDFCELMLIPEILMVEMIPSCCCCRCDIQPYEVPLFRITELTPINSNQAINMFLPGTYYRTSTTDQYQTITPSQYQNGNRNGSQVYYVDGVKSDREPIIPMVSINDVTVYTGGVPANYGDATGAVIILNTKSYFDLYYERNGSR